MPKRKPSQRWRDRILERYQLFRASSEFKKLRARGLRILGRKKLVTTEEWWEAKHKKLWASADYGAFQSECRRAADMFGLADWIPEMACLLKGYSPDRRPFRPFFSGAVWPNVSVVTTCSDRLFQDWLLWEETSLNSPERPQPSITVVYRNGGKEDVLIAVPFPSKPSQQLTADRRPKSDKAYSLRVEFPPDFPPEGGAEVTRAALQCSRDLLRRLGYRVPHRLRGSKLPSQARTLRPNKPRLSQRESGDIAEDLYGEGSAQDPRKISRALKQRSRLKDMMEDLDRPESS